MEEIPGLDMFPALLTVDEDKHLRARLWINDGHMRAFKESHLGNIELVAEGEVESFEKVGGRRNMVRLTLKSGETIEAQRSGGCGCASPLKRLSPARWPQS